MMAQYTAGLRNEAYQPVYFQNGRYAYAIRSNRNGAPNSWSAERANCGKYRTTPKNSGLVADRAAALAWCDADLAIVRPSGVAATTTTAGFTVPAVGASITVPFASTTGYVTGMSVNIAGAGVYQITNVASPNVTIKNLGSPGNAAPATVVATGAAVNATAGPG